MVPSALRAAGRTVFTLWEIFGPAMEGRIGDDVWVQHAYENALVVLTADKQIRRDYPDLFGRCPSPVFQLSRGDLAGGEQAARFIRAIDAIERVVAREAPPFIYSVRADGLTRLWPPLRSPAVSRR